MMINYFKKITAFVFLFFLFLVFPAFASWPDQGVVFKGYPMMGNGMGWMMFLFWGMVLGILILIIRWISRLTENEIHRSKTKKPAMDILKERLAKGKIDSGG